MSNQILSGVSPKHNRDDKEIFCNIACNAMYDVSSSLLSSYVRKQYVFNICIRKCSGIWQAFDVSNLVYAAYY